MIAGSDFLMGRKQTEGRKPFVLAMYWALQQENVSDILLGKYKKSIYAVNRSISSAQSIKTFSEKDVHHKNTRFREPYGEIHDLLVESKGIAEISSWFHTLNIIPLGNCLKFIFLNTWMAKEVEKRYGSLLRKCAKTATKGEFTRIEITAISIDAMRPKWDLTFRKFEDCLYLHESMDAKSLDLIFHNSSLTLTDNTLFLTYPYNFLANEVRNKHIFTLESCARRAFPNKDMQVEVLREPPKQMEPKN
jgi:uncharacterized protein (DUF2132 family)